MHSNRIKLVLAIAVAVLAWSGSPAVALVAPLKCGGTPAAACYQGQLLHEAQGSAALSTDASGHLIVSNIGSSGQDGVRIDLGDGAASFNLNTLEIDPNGTVPNGAFVEIAFEGAHGANGGGPVSLGSGLIEDTGAQLEISADFTPVGVTTQRIEVYLKGAQMAVFTGHTGVAATVANWGSSYGKVGVIDPNSGTSCMHVDWDKSLPINVVGESTVIGDELRILVENQPEPTLSLTSFTMLAKDISSFTIIREDAAPLRGIPTLSEWGLAALAAFLLAIGAFMVRRRRRGEALA